MLWAYRGADVGLLTYHGAGVRVQIENADDGESSFGRVVEFPRFVDVGPTPIAHVTIRP